jgi:hypothetical protein
MTTRTWKYAAAAALLGASMAPAPAAMASALARPEATMLTSSVADRLSTGSAQRMIIVLRDQSTGPAVAGSARRSAVADLQQGVRRDLGTLHVTGARPLTTVNAIAAPLTPGQAAWVADRSDVAAVVADRPVRPVAAAELPTAASEKRQAVTADPACPSDPSAPLVGQDLTLTHAMSPNGSTAPAAQDLATGRGVRVGLLTPDVLDPTNPEFIRADGSHVIVEDRTFGTGGDIGGQEAFGDASAVAAQGSGSYDVSTYGFAQHPLPAGCTVRVRGMAPDASLYVANFSFTSEVIAAIDHLVYDDHVDVINEAFGFPLLPDDPDGDPFVLANRAAVRAGVTVVNPSGDGGIDSSQTSPGSDPGIIDVGATTAGRFYEQLKIAGFTFGNGRAEDNQPASLSSDGYATAGPRIIDVVAPGDGGWNACTPRPEFAACVTMTGAPSSFRAFRGTSESSPLTAGEAALVIQRYRDTHDGTSPTPQQVKAIIMSSATDLHVTARVQGSGLIDALAAVRLAGRAPGLVAGGESLGLTGAPGQDVVTTVPVTNNDTQPISVRPELQTMRTVAAATIPVVLDPYHDPKFFCAGPSSGVTRTIDVPRGLDQLTVEAAGAIDPQVGPQNAAVNLTLIDPSGRWANWSSSALPSAPFAHVEVARPAPGRWTVLVWTGQDDHGWHGAVSLHWRGSRLQTQSAGRARTIRAGASASLPVTVSMPSRAGDSDARLALVGPHGTTVLPAALRTRVAMDGGHGSFGGTLTGIVGRTANGGTEIHAYEVPVDSSRSLELDLHLAELTMVHAYLIDPSGDLVAERTNCIDPEGHQLIKDLVMYLDHPMRGTWTIALEQDRAHSTASGYENPFTVELRPNTIAVGTSGVPRGQTLQSGQPVTATVTVTNTGAQQQAFYADARLDHQVDLPLAQLGTAHVTVPTTDFAHLPVWLVPPGTTGLTVTGTSTVPIDFDLFPPYDDPDALSTVGTTAVATVSRPEVPPTLWSVTGDAVDPADAGSGADFAAVARTAAFDPDVVSSTGDAWRIAVDPTATTTPLVVPAHDSGTLTVTITPHGTPGTTVSGTLYVDMGDCVAGVGDTVVAVPYSYTIG